MTNTLVLGVEGGATRTTAALLDGRRRVLAEQAAGPANVHAVGRAAAGRAVAELIRSLLAEAGAAAGDLSAAAFCMAGLRSGADRATWRRLVARLGVACPLLLTHDAAAGLAAAGGREGILVICGTGSLVYGRRGDGRECFVGGRGPVLGDAGSGFDIGQQGLRAAVRAADGWGPPTSLERLILDRLGLAGVDELVAYVSPFAKDRIAAVAPIVFEAAGAGDRPARRIIGAAQRHLLRGVLAVRRRLWPPRGGRPARAGRDLRLVVFSGGVLRGQPAFRRALAAAIRQRMPAARCVVPRASGAVGAARLALDLLLPPRRA